MRKNSTIRTSAIIIIILEDILLGFYNIEYYFYFRNKTKIIKIIKMEIEFLDYILTNLKILSLVQINQKISIYKGHLQIDYHALQFIKRWINKDSRESLIIFLNDLLKKINHLFKNSDKDKLEVISTILNEIDKIKLNNLKITYTDDPITVVKLDTIFLHFKKLSVYGRALLIEWD